MDGTLWDPMDLYVAAWNNGLKAAGVDKSMTKEDLQPLMGMEGKKVLEITLGEFSEDKQAAVYEKINEQRKLLIEQGGGTPFEGMQEGIQQMAEKYKLFIVSNCPEGLLDLFTKRTEISAHITDVMEYGMNNMPKHHNIRILMERHGLKNPVYVGDTDGDRLQSEKAGIPFIFISCGFGSTDKFHLKFDDFKSLTSHFIGL